MSGKYYGGKYRAFGRDAVIVGQGGQQRQFAHFARDNNASTAALTVAVTLAIDRLLTPQKRAGRLKKRERKTQRTVESKTENSVVVDTETFRGALVKCAYDTLLAPHSAPARDRRLGDRRSGKM